MLGGAAKAALFDALASVAQALGSGRRAEIVDVLAQGERSVDEIAGEISQSVANTSQHLQQMRRAGVVAARRQGKFVFYTLSDEAVLDLLSALRRIAERNGYAIPIANGCRKTEWSIGQCDREESHAGMDRKVLWTHVRHP